MTKSKARNNAWTAAARCVNIASNTPKGFHCQMNMDEKGRRTNSQEITEETENRHSPLFSLFAPVQIFRFLSVFHRCLIRGSVVSFASSSFVVLTIFFFTRREVFLSRGFGRTRNGKKSIPKRVKPKRARRAQRLQTKYSRREPVDVSPFSLGDLCALCG